jgi:hypothetical protein
VATFLLPSLSVAKLIYGGAVSIYIKSKALKQSVFIKLMGTRQTKNVRTDELGNLLMSVAFSGLYVNEICLSSFYKRKC